MRHLLFIKCLCLPLNVLLKCKSEILCAFLEFFLSTLFVVLHERSSQLVLR